MHVDAPTKHHRQWRNLGWRAKKTHTEQQLDVERSNARGTERADEEGGGVQEGGGEYGEDSRTRKSTKDPKTRPGGGPKAAAQLSRLESVALLLA